MEYLKLFLNWVDVVKSPRNLFSFMGFFLLVTPLSLKASSLLEVPSPKKKLEINTVPLCINDVAFLTRVSIPSITATAEVESADRSTYKTAIKSENSNSASGEIKPFFLKPNDIACAIECLPNILKYIGSGQFDCQMSINENAPQVTGCVGEDYRLEWELFSQGLMIANGDEGINENLEPGITEVVYSLIDEGGDLLDQCFYLIEIRDTFIPSLTSPVTVFPFKVDGNTECEITVDVSDFTPNFSDNCLADLNVKYTITEPSGKVNTYNLSQGLNTYSFPLGQSYVMWRATDFSGNMAEFEILIVVTDDLAPVIISCTDDKIDVSNSGSCQVALAIPAILIDNTYCDKSSEQTYLIQPGGFRGIPPSTEILDIGSYTVYYEVRDFSGNLSTCFFQVNIRDSSDPEIIGCPVDRSKLIVDGCLIMDTIQLPQKIEDDCFEDQFIRDSIEHLMTFDAQTGTANEMVFDFDNENLHGFSDMRLRFFVWGDVDNPLEQFAIFDEFGNSLGNTSTGLGANCENSVMVNIDLDGADVKSWLQDDQKMTIRVVPIGITGGGTQGADPDISAINDFCPSNSIGEPRILAVISYPEINSLFYRVKGQMDTSVLLPLAVNKITEHEFQVGLNEVELVFYDKGGNSTSCSYKFEAVDRTMPTVECKAGFSVVLDPDAANLFEINPNDLLESTSDNCFIVDTILNITSINCLMAENSPIIVELTVVDVSGNRASCSSEITVEIGELQLSYNTGLCEGEDLEILADPLVDNPSFNYSFTWYDPNGLEIGSTRNLTLIAVDASLAGEYILIVRNGTLSCELIGSIDVEILNTSSQVSILNTATSICENQELILECSDRGDGVEYEWYQLISNNLTLLGTTSDPVFTVPALIQGVQQFRVTVINGTCGSPISGTYQIDILESGSFSFLEDQIDFCEGTPLQLESGVTADEYLWIGPNGFIDSSQNPIVESEASLTSIGYYFLQVKRAGCFSAFDSIYVNVKPVLDQPEIIASTVICPDTDLVLRTNEGNADEYTWTFADGNTETTLINTILIPSSEVDFGNYQVQVILDGCESVISEPKRIVIEAGINLKVTSNSPLCKGDSLALGATSSNGVSYEWVGPAFTSLDPDPTRFNPIQGQYRLTVESGNSCFFYDSVEVIINPLPILQGIKTSIDRNLCLTGNDTLILSGMLGANLQNLSYHWTTPDGNEITGEELIFLNADTDLNGVYTLVIQNESGCFSAIKSINLNYGEAPPPPIIVFSNPICAGDTLLVTSSTRTGQNLIYEWRTPAGDRADTIPDLIFPNARKIDHEGNYQVRVSINDCNSVFSPEVFIDVYDQPNTPSIYGKTDYCSGDSIILTTDENSNVQYEWLGPNAFSDTSYIIVPSSNVTNSGAFTLRIQNELLCYSDVASIHIDVFNKPEQPILISNSPICENEDLILQVNSSLTTDSVLWTRPDGQTFITIAEELEILYDDIEEGGWTVRSYLGSCISDISESESVIVEEVFNISLMANSPLCECDTLVLNASFVENSNYSWRDASDREIGNTRILNVTDVEEGYYYLAWESPLSCHQRDSIEIKVKDRPIVNGISFEGEACVDGSQTIKLIPEIEGVFSDFDVLWTGPFGYSIEDTLILDNVNTGANGEYELILSDDNNCKSEVRIFDLELYEIPALPTISQTGIVCEGDSVFLETQGFVGNNVRYIWNVEGLELVSNFPSLSLSTNQLNPTDQISVQVVTDNCESPISVNFTPNITGLPGLPPFIFPTSLCNGDSLILEAEEMSNTLYFWEGPLGFTSGLRKPIVFDVDESYEGYYTLKVVVDGCSSPVSDSVFIEIKDIPSAPIIESIESICISQGENTFDIILDSSSNYIDASYSFYFENNDALLIGPSSDLVLSVSSQGLTGGIYYVYAVTNLEGCLSEASQAIELGIFEIPDSVSAVALDEVIVCDEEKRLIANILPGGSYYRGEWTQIYGPNSVGIKSPNSPHTDIEFEDLVGGEDYSFQWSISYGACEDYDRDTLNLTKIDVRSLGGTTEIDLCNRDSVKLSGDLPTTNGVTAYWSQRAYPDQTIRGVVIVDSLNPNSVIRNLVPGNIYRFRWYFTTEECPDYSFEEVVITVRSQSPCVSNAGQDQMVCEGPEVSIEAGSNGGCFGKWSTPGSAEIVTQNSNITEVVNLEVGENLFIYFLSDARCALFSRDTVVVNYLLPAEPIDDHYDFEFASLGFLDVLENDLRYEDAFIEVVDYPENGSITQIGDSLTYFAGVRYIGDDMFTYRLCDLRCINYCDTATVTLSIGDDLDCQVPTMITPNNDGINDYFIVPCLASDDFPNNQLTIFNQWGDEIYMAAPYSNDWGGDYNGNQLTDGTYFFIMNFGDKRPTESGFLLIQR